MFEQYPQTGFQFLVTFELFPPDHLPNLKDISFQSVSGLSVTVNMEDYREGGENRFVHKLPTSTSYPDLILKRGLFLESQITGIIPWFRDAIDNFQFKPVNIMISLMSMAGDVPLPLFNWYVVGAIPKKLEISNFNAEQSQIVVETMTLDYQYWKPMDAGTLAGAALGAAVNVSVGF